MQTKTPKVCKLLAQARRGTLIKAISVPIGRPVLSSESEGTKSAAPMMLLREKAPCHRRFLRSNIRLEETLRKGIPIRACKKGTRKSEHRGLLLLSWQALLNWTISSRREHPRSEDRG